MGGRWSAGPTDPRTMPHCPSRAPVTSLRQRFLQAGGHPGNASAFEGPGGPSSPSPKTRIRGKQEPRRLAPSFGVTTSYVVPLGKTALHWAAAVNNSRAARSLLQAGADKDAQDGRVRPGSGHPRNKRARRRGAKRANSAKPEGEGGRGPAVK